MINKKATTSKVIGVIISLIFAVIIILVVIPWVVSSFQKLNPIDEMGDCDRDNVNNFRDKCPCLSTKGVEEEKLPGCPLGTSPDEADYDTKSCSYFVSKSNPDNFVPKCDQDDEDLCMTKCDKVNGELPDLPESAGKGIAGNYDLGIKEFSLSVAAESKPLVNNQLDLDLKGEEKAELTLEPTIINYGADAANLPFYLGLKICSSKNKKECTSATLTSGTSGNKAWSLKNLGAGESKKLEKQTFQIGLGDYCDGQGDTGCFVKIVVDSENNLAETEEFNNEKSFFLVLSNKKMKEGTFTKYKTIELVLDADGDATPQDSPISQMCPGYIGQKSDSDGFGCDSAGFEAPNFAYNCESGEFPSEKEPFSPGKGCLLVVSEEDEMDYDCGYAGAENGVIIDRLTPNKITSFKTPFLNTDGTDAANALTYKWKALESGSLLCNADQWHLCDTKANFQSVIINEVSFICKEKRWIKN
ncbi:MAG TPA: hypothetical protein VJA23_00785 [Candidatus Nanoarchaeia archaeon]|nr:hypothetical protein [Candidatus Nanoarchaeia archaeon]